MLLAFMVATAIISMIVSNTATTLIMMPIALAVLVAAQVKPGHTDGFAGALAMGIAFAASIGGLGTLVGSPTNAIAAGIIERATGLQIGFLTWAMYGMPLVLLVDPALLVDPDEGPAGRSRPTSTRPQALRRDRHRGRVERPPRSGWCR